MSTQQRLAIAKAIEIDRAITRKLCYQSLSHFTRTFWPVIEPGQPYMHGWHIDAICDHLEAVSRFDITKLIVNMPPRHMKSTIACVMFPAWVWLHWPERSFIYASYSATLATRDSIKTRTIIESPLYQSLFKPEWTLREDQNLKTNFQNTLMGSRKSLGVGGSIIGEGGDYLFIDDPINALDALSEAVRTEVNAWHDTVFSTRYNNPQRHAKVIVMQRLTENDLTGHVLEKKGRYEHLVLPAKFDEANEMKSNTSLGFKDPRTQQDELLWPERFDEQSIADLEDDLEGDAEAQLNQNPQPKEGGLFPEEHWQYFDKSPSQILETVQFWDCAQKPGISNDFSVCATWVRTANGYFVLDVWREKTTGPLLEEMAIALYDKWRPDTVVIEDKSAGSSLIQYLLLNTTIPVLPFNPKGDKEVRASAATPTVKAGKVHLPIGAPWVKGFISEHKKFPKVKHDDQVDTTSMAIKHLSKRNMTGPRVRSI